MKKLLSALLALAAVCALSVTAMADVIWEPADNDFYTAHRDECVYEGRSYYINAARGAAALYAAPDSDEVAAEPVNGAEVFIGYTCEYGGGTWGLADYNIRNDKEHWLGWKTGKESGTGWVKMSDLLVIYDEQSFENEHSPEFQTYDGSFDSLLTSDDQRVIVWSYPGSGTVSADFDKLHTDYAAAMTVDTVWTDSDGRIWGKVGYYMGARGWVCLSEPASENLPVTEHKYDLYPAADTTVTPGAGGAETAQPAETSDSVNMGLMFGVAAVCGITGLLLFSLRRKKAD